VKTIGLMPRRPDTTRAEFRDHYEGRHAPLALGKFPFVKYVRNHVVASVPDPVGFDCLSEFWVNDVAEVLRLMAGPTGDTMREDERRFTDQPRIAPAVADELLLFGPERVFEDGIVHKEMLLLSADEGVAPEKFSTTLDAWGRQLGATSAGRLWRVTRDLLTPFEGRYHPGYQAVLQGWTRDGGNLVFDAAAPDTFRIEVRIRTETIETRLD
jgi:uncharacterized protein (TIGR02118 family)